ncbi:MAG: glycosyltransferase, partial [Acidimicrobiia bacterium]
MRLPCFCLFVSLDCESRTPPRRSSLWSISTGPPSAELERCRFRRENPRNTEETLALTDTLTVSKVGAMPTLSVLMPVYNESRTLRTIVARVLESPVECDIELICVDDCSSDDSLA